ncbi:hypothetical protein HDU97_009931 [Phlyctochytrium planicorne]|nr:hypothetical protein HDU97_009931 [Phlyctochytrium planicorne]
MNQFRTVTILFLRVPHIPVQNLGISPKVYEDVKFVASESIRIVSKHGGTCRQIHVDEKALSVLLVWGLEGFSHEKGDYEYAISAGMELEKLLKERKWWWEYPEMGNLATDTPVGFSLALTAGKAFCGLIGTEARH